jgi:hypothetical protein
LYGLFKKKKKKEKNHFIHIRFYVHLIPFFTTKTSIIHRFLVKFLRSSLLSKDLAKLKFDHHSDGGGGRFQEEVEKKMQRKNRANYLGTSI